MGALKFEWPSQGAPYLLVADGVVTGVDCAHASGAEFQATHQVGDAALALHHAAAAGFHLTHEAVVSVEAVVNVEVGVNVEAVADV